MSEQPTATAASPLWTLAMWVYSKRDTCYCDAPKGHAGWLDCIEREMDKARKDAADE